MARKFRCMAPNCYDCKNYRPSDKTCGLAPYHEKKDGEIIYHPAKWERNHYGINCCGPEGTHFEATSEAM